MMVERVVAGYLQSRPDGWRSASKYSHLQNAWEKRLGSEPLNQRNLERFREVCRTEGLSPHTYETQISDLITAAKACGLHLSAGPRDRRRRPEPKILTADQIGRAYDGARVTTWPRPRARMWWEAAIVLIFWTCLRRQDIATLTWSEVDLDRGIMTRTANKTGHRHVIPLPPFVVRHLRQLPRQSDSLLGLPTHFQKSMLAQCCKISTASGIKITPQAVRRAGITAWTRANTMAGQIIHGSGLGILNHYVDPLQVLQAAAPRVVVPDQFLTLGERADRQAGLSEVSERFASLDPTGQQTVLDMLRRFA